MPQKILVKRGIKNNLPTLSQGEPAYTTDTKDFYVGDGTTNIKLAKNDILLKHAVTPEEYGAIGNANYYNPSDKKFYATSDFSVLANDDTIALQNAFNSPQKQIKLTGKYRITAPIDITGKTVIMGDSMIGQGNAVIAMDFTVLDYALYCPQNVTGNFTMKHFSITAYSGIDLRSNSASVQKIFNIEEVGFYNSTFGGIAIHSINTDFSSIKNCHFQGMFYTSIRCSGYLDAVYTNNKNSTQIDIEGCSFIQVMDYSAGVYAGAISLEQVDSCHITKCDFAYNGTVAIDIGGYYYKKDVPATTGYYYKAQNNRTASIGSCTYVDVKDCHFESYNIGIGVHGGDIESIYKVLIDNNNFQTPKNSSTAISCNNGVFFLTTKNNGIDLKNVASAVGIYLGSSCYNAFLDNDDIVGISTSFIVDNGTNTSYIKRNSQGKLRNEISWGYPVMNVPSIITNDIISKPYSMSLAKSCTIGIEKQIQKDVITNNNQIFKLVDIVNASNFAGVLTILEVNSIGRSSSVWHFTEGTITKISGTAVHYGLSVDTSGIFYQQQYPVDNVQHQIIGNCQYVSMIV